MSYETRMMADAIENLMAEVAALRERAERAELRLKLLDSSTADRHVVTRVHGGSLMVSLGDERWAISPSLAKAIDRAAGLDAADAKED